MEKKPFHKTTDNSVFIILLFAVGGAFMWGLRGSAGYGGTSGAVMPGLWWGLCWYALAAGDRKGAGWVVLACAFGYGFGGMHGYGQFMDWIRGVFAINRQEGVFLPLNPAVGFMWWAITGLGWGGFGGIMLSWALDRKRNAGVMVVRALILIAGWIIGSWAVRNFPQFVFPHYSPETYDLSVCVDCRRTLYTLPTQGSFITMLVFSLLFESVRLKWTQVRTIALSALGFGIAFPLANLHNAYLTLQITYDTWKMFEMMVGFIGGAMIGVMYLVDRGAIIGRWEASAAQTLPERLAGVNLAILLVLGWAGVNCTGVIGKDFFGLIEGHPFMFYAGLPSVVLPGLVIYVVSARNLITLKRADGTVPLDTKPWVKLRSSLMLMTVYGVIVTCRGDTKITATYIIIGGMSILLSVILQRNR
ncbi:MAG: hypothetical protein AB1546_06080 [bacterium]